MARRLDIPPSPEMTMAELLGEHFLMETPEHDPKPRRAPEPIKAPPKRKKRTRAKV